MNRQIPKTYYAARYGLLHIVVCQDHTFMAEGVTTSPMRSSAPLTCFFCKQEQDSMLEPLSFPSYRK